MKKVTTTVSDQRLCLSVPMTFKKNGGRKKIILSENKVRHGASDPKLQKPLLLALARAHRWKAVIEQGRFDTVTELAAALGVDPSCAGRILRLTLLAPDIVEAIVNGGEPSGLSLEKLVKKLPLDWETQRLYFLSE